MFHVKHSVAAVLVLLAAVTGLMWPKSNIQAEDVIEPIPVRTLSYHLSMQGDEKVVTFPEKVVTYPAWTVREDGLWVPWTMQPPAWWTAIASGPVMAEAVPLPPERPMDKTTPKKGEVLSIPEPSPRRIATPDGGLCAKHGLRQVWTSATHWRCR